MSLKVAKGSWYLDQLIHYDGQDNVSYERVFNNPRIRTCMNEVEFIHYTNTVEQAGRNLLAVLDSLGVSLLTMDDLASIINDTNGGA